MRQWGQIGQFNVGGRRPWTYAFAVILAKLAQVGLGWSSVEAAEKSGGYEEVEKMGCDQ